MTTIEQAGPTFLWLEITGRCQLQCTHCYADSGPDGTHGSMTVADWRRTIDEAADLGVRTVQFIGGEPTLHPALATLVEHAVARGLRVEVFSNLVHVTEEHWTVFELPGVSLATSYYSDDPRLHAAITGRPSHARTLANIAEALKRGIPLRAGVIELDDGQRGEQARDQLARLGVARIGHDRLRGVGRGARDGGRSAAQLCGHCGDRKAAVRPDGTVSPCVMSRWVAAGNVHDGTLADATAGIPAARAALTGQGMPRGRDSCDPDDCAPEGGDCYPINCHPYR